MRGKKMRKKEEIGAKDECRRVVQGLKERKGGRGVQGQTDEDKRGVQGRKNEDEGKVA
jgi:hypothetical protein